ncbi:LysE family transporter [Parvibaculum sp.]|jgi:threonine/homoserine/homoserine lactone efflux protein|uniref:LysE family translocator n=1 Tax=Parvibaculum sp. TaxID=2024848 RepID=UPI000C4DF754|nr:LysE family transporter [Parvibaculum sp.]HAC57054.1 lysine transporter LysE [Rhodobiaceae bacterium]MAU62120.1 lysine transporter LysE [Parvibaculum sp.]MBO6667012.1 LysE family transporter [Parvibaculum sp.]MBO6690456.1 LysE family transporter [Parvibaculum sp.]MBO6713633.1 LysE family transporter [Parvibaculum sp.]|tara:strand:- start:2556 stop:3197 length:642 start_codon:yes stop_codon:yes gene_type:complete
MIDFGLVANGIAIGLAVAAPIGPVNLIVIRRTLRYGQLNGFLSGAGAATGDAIFAAIAAFGLTAAIELVIRFETALQIVGGLFLLALGLRTWFVKPHFDDTAEENLSGAMAAVFATTFFLTITNPATMLGFIAIFGGVAGLADAGEDYAHAATIVIAVMAGSALWWAGLSGFVSLFRQKMNDRLLGIVNRVSGALIIIFGAVVLVRVACSFLL